MGKQVFENDRSITDHDVITAMDLHGGSFASHLAVACLYADEENLARIKIAFADLWACYRDVAERAKAQQVAA